MNQPAATGPSRRGFIPSTWPMGKVAAVRALKRCRARQPELDAMRALHLRIAWGGFLASTLTVALGCALCLAR